jgi:FixJ family two-component response regulator
LASSDLLLTGHTGNNLLDPAYAVLEKPFERSDLLSVIRSAIDGLPKPDSHATRQQSLPPYHVAA